MGEVIYGDDIEAGEVCPVCRRGNETELDAEKLRKVLETVRAICRGASAAGTPEMGLQTVIDCVNIAIDPGVVEEASDAE